MRAFGLQTCVGVCGVSSRGRRLPCPKRDSTLGLSCKRAVSRLIVSGVPPQAGQQSKEKSPVSLVGGLQPWVRSHTRLLIECNTNVLFFVFLFCEHCFFFNFVILNPRGAFFWCKLHSIFFRLFWDVACDVLESSCKAFGLPKMWSLEMAVCFVAYYYKFIFLL